MHSESYDLTRDLLDTKGWKEPRHFEELLKCFEKAAKRAEGNAITGSHGALWEVIPIVNYLSNTLKKRADEITAWASLSIDHYQHCINHGFVKLQKCCTKIDDSCSHSAAVTLDPCRKFTYFEQA